MDKPIVVKVPDTVSTGKGEVWKELAQKFVDRTEDWTSDDIIWTLLGELSIEQIDKLLTELGD